MVNQAEERQLDVIRSVAINLGGDFMKGLLAFLLLAVGPAVVLGICPKPTPKVCSAFFESDAVFLGTVLSEETVPDKNEPGFTEGWRYRLRVAKAFRGVSGPTVLVHTANDSGRLILRVGREYLLFARKQDQELQVYDDCGPLSDLSRRAEIAREIENFGKATGAFVEGEVVRETASGAGVSGVDISVSGTGHTSLAISDTRGLFRVAVPAGRYTIDVDPTLATLSDLSGIDLKQVELARGQCAQAQFIAR
jgi:hypothetical protein